MKRTPETAVVFRSKSNASSVKVRRAAERSRTDSTPAESRHGFVNGSTGGPALKRR
jgi:hypothetical protein